ncbi:hypothetical protein HAX54_024066, partial [Datura stramonium]|nr:hypothetical protein [Datura stramonium]
FTASSVYSDKGNVSAGGGKLEPNSYGNEYERDKCGEEKILGGIICLPSLRHKKGKCGMIHPGQFLWGKEGCFGCGHL